MLQREIPSYFKARRERLLAAHPGAVFLFPSTPVYARNSDVHYPFRQESHFYYLTGFHEEHSFLVLLPATSKNGRSRSILFVQSRDPEKEIWEGERYGIDGTADLFSVDEVYPIEELEKKLPDLLKLSERVFYRMGLFPQEDRLVLEALSTYRMSQGRTGCGLLPVEDSHQAVSELRLFKSPEEVSLLRRACQMSAQGHLAAMKETRPGMNECEVEALVDYTFRKLGCQRLGYSSIVAGGKNATCLHYHLNNEPLNDGDLLLIDAGGEYSYYTADITRTFPVGKTFTSAQRKVYEWVLKSQKEAIAMVRPGVTLPAIHERVCEVLIEGMLSMGLATGSPQELLKSRSFRQFYPHSTSHWLGMDVHDAGLYVQGGEPRALEPGMVLTIEPGLYIRPLTGVGFEHSFPKEYLNIGIRIEDDILVTEKGQDNLSKDAPKEIVELERLRA